MGTPSDDRNLKFSLDLFHFLTAEEGQRNICFSPSCMSACFGMVYLGALRGEQRPESAEFVELATVFGYPRNLTEFYRFVRLLKSPERTVVANGIFVDIRHPASHWYQEQLRSIFQVELGLLDFQEKLEESRTTINDWVQELTHGHIQPMLLPGSISRNSSVILVSAVFFDDRWRKSFVKNVSGTKISSPLKDFYIDSQQTVKTEMMYVRDLFQSKHVSALKATVVQLAYLVSPATFIAVLPDEVEGLTTVTEKLTAEVFRQVLQELEEMETILEMPKFRMKLDMDLSKEMQRLGVKKIFQTDANLGELRDPSKPWPTYSQHVSEAVHQTLIQVHEEGTRASAATTLSIGLKTKAKTTQPEMEPRHIVLDRPFFHDSLSRDFPVHVSCPEQGCTSIMMNQEALSLHRMTKHSEQAGETNVMCDICGDTVQAKQMNRHVAQHVKLGIYQCKKCRKRFKRPRDYHQHKLHAHQSTTIHSCPECGAEFDDVEDLEQHQATVHVTVSSSDELAFTVAAEEEVLSADGVPSGCSKISIVNGDKFDQPLTCGMCREFTAFESRELARHLVDCNKKKKVLTGAGLGKLDVDELAARAKQVKGTDGGECPLCFETVPRLRHHIWEHMSEVNPVNTPIPTSDEALEQTASTSEPSTLESSTLTTSNSKSSSTLGSSAALKSSNWEESSNLGSSTSSEPRSSTSTSTEPKKPSRPRHEPVFECIFCPKAFVSSVNRKKHILRSHPAVPTVYECYICYSLFFTDDMLKKHEEEAQCEAMPLPPKQPKPSLPTKKKRRTHRCPVCFVEFSNLTTRRLHISDIHTDLTEVFECEICHEMFIDEASVELHSVSQCRAVAGEGVDYEYEAPPPPSELG
ncbi:unnamed protein product [Cyprideis torosa]|uniref:Uncharacterized protein n=1 Tax=Cyprideis torosa TaxID=163714 RepID=A0A7R8W5R3_9CRUS|nr:unnamed protein product [Cyprideis torosa]CAG0883186.1 unnamed protein product [Cyprideis torosa]